jgi:hypothetical protein
MGIIEKMRTGKSIKKPKKAFSQNRTLRASMTIEAALALPIFLFFMLSILYIFQIIYLQTESYQILHQAGHRIAFSAYAQREDYGEGTVEFTVAYPIVPYLWWRDFGFLHVSQQYYGYAWIGYELGQGEGESEGEDEYVYITETGTVYHVTMNCTHLSLSISSVELDEVDALRNKGGAKYYPCEICSNGKKSVVFITDTGNRFHDDVNCSGLKRTVTKITLDEAVNQGYRGCSRCS